MALHLAIIGVVHIRIRISIACNFYIPKEYPGLDEYKGPKSTMIQLSDTTTYPKAVMVKFSDASSAILTMFGPER